MARFCAWIVPALVLLIPRTGRAQTPPPVPVHVDYSAAAHCPTKSRFLRRLHAHTQRLRLSNDPEALQLLIVVVSRGDKFVGRLDVRRGVTALGTRQFADADCAEVVAALALSAALSIDPEAKLDAGPEPETGGGEASGPTAPAGPEAAPSEPTGPPETNYVPPVTDVTRPEEESSDEPRTWRVSAGPQLALGFAFDPKAALGFGFSIGIHRVPDRTWFPVDGSVAFDYLTTRPTRGGDPLRLDWYTFRMGYCPLRAGGETALLACSVGYGGWLSAEGVAIDAPRSVNRSFLMLGLGLRGRVRLGDNWLLHSDLDLGVPLSQRTYAIGPDMQVVANSRPVGAVLAVGVRGAF